jgi:hypothetical protein
VHASIQRGKAEKLSSGFRLVWGRRPRVDSAPPIVSLRNVVGEGLPTAFVPVRSWRGLQCEFCRSVVTVILFLGAAKSGLCCYTNHLIREFRQS